VRAYLKQEHRLVKACLIIHTAINYTRDAHKNEASHVHHNKLFVTKKNIQRFP
jgi:hypothetical protein